MEQIGKGVHVQSPELEQFAKDLQELLSDANSTASNIKHKVNLISNRPEPKTGGDTHAETPDNCAMDNLKRQIIYLKRHNEVLIEILSHLNQII